MPINDVRYVQIALASTLGFRIDFGGHLAFSHIHPAWASVLDCVSVVLFV